MIYVIAVLWLLGFLLVWGMCAMSGRIAREEEAREIERWRREAARRAGGLMVSGRDEKAIAETLALWIEHEAREG